MISHAVQDVQSALMHPPGFFFISKESITIYTSCNPQPDYFIIAIEVPPYL